MNCERIGVELNGEVQLYSGPGLDFSLVEGFAIEEGGFFIYPLENQNLDGGWIVLGRTASGLLDPKKYYLPFGESKKDDLVHALRRIEILINANKVVSLTPRLKADLLSIVETGIRGVCVVGPDSVHGF